MTHGASPFGYHVTFITQTVNETGHRRQNQEKNDRFRPLEPKESIRRQNAINSLFCNNLWEKTGVSVYSLSFIIYSYH